MNLPGISLTSLALLGLEWARPLGLLALLLPLALVLLLRRSERARPLATGTLPLWEEVGEEQRSRSRRTRRGLPPRARMLCAALALAALAVAGPRREAPPASEGWRVVVDRSPSMYLPLEAGGERTRYDAALAAAREHLDSSEGGLAEREWITPGEPPQRGVEPPAAWRKAPRARREEPRWERRDGPGHLWLTDRAPAPPEGGATLVASGGGPAPGLVDTIGGREILWDGARLVEGGSAPGGRVVVSDALPAELRQLAEIWADERELELGAKGTLADRGTRLLVLGAERGGRAPVRAGRDGWGIVGAVAEGGAPAEDEEGALELWLSSPDGRRRLVSSGPGRVRVAWTEIEQLAGDPAAFAVSWARLFDHALLPPEGAVPVGERQPAGDPCLIPGEVPITLLVRGAPERVPPEAWLALGALALAALALFSQRSPSTPRASRPDRAG